MTFAEKLSRLMSERGLTLQALADAVGVSNPAVHGWLNGARPRPATAKALADYFGVSVGDLGLNTPSPFEGDASRLVSPLENSRSAASRFAVNELDYMGAILISARFPPEVPQYLGELRACYKFALYLADEYRRRTIAAFEKEGALPEEDRGLLLAANERLRKAKMGVFPAKLMGPDERIAAAKAELLEAKKEWERLVERLFSESPPPSA